MRRLAIALALLAAPSARAETPAAAGEGPSYVWELDAFAGYGQLAYPALDTANVNWSNGGPGFALAVAYRGPHFTHPFLELSYVPIIASGRSVYAAGSTGAQPAFASNSSWAVGLMFGPGFDVDRFRFRAGIGFYSVSVKTTVLDVTNTVSKLDLGFVAAASAFVWRREPFAVGVEARIAALQTPFTGISQAMWELGLGGRWDFSRR